MKHMSIKDYIGDWFSAQDITNILNGKSLKGFYETAVTKKYKKKTVQNRLRKVELGQFTHDEQIKFKNFEWIKKSEPKFVKHVTGPKGHTEKLYSRYYVDILLELTQDQRDRNVQQAIQDAILAATFKPAELAELVKSKLGEIAYRDHEYDYEAIAKSVYNRQRKLKTATWESLESYKRQYVQPLQADIDDLNERMKLIHQIAGDQSLAPELRTYLIDQVTIYDYAQSKQIISAILKS